jgi:small nuclear ribonucleoprotein (snRNP)-like protein
MPRREPSIQRCLGILLVSLQGEEVTIELKNDIELIGIIEEADENMNVTLHDVKQIFPNGSIRNLEITFVNGTNIRYVHIPSRIHAVKHLGSYVSSISIFFCCLISFR